MNLFQSDVSLIDSLGYSILGMAIVFTVLIMLIGVVKIVEQFTKRLNKEEVSAETPAAAAAPAAAPAPAPAKPAPGTAGELKLYNVEERDAAMVMAIVADKLGKPLNELRFISIREVTEQ
ncbi:MAG: OadG family protein [Oscillospiraceae bacterium]|nr:OadG family protein [Oscillospiraceae bacterium]